MRSPRMRLAGWLRGAVLVALILSMLAVNLGQSSVTFAREIEVVGTVQCDRPSGARCTIDDTLVVRTDQVTGRPSLASIDVRWVKDALPGLDQDDEITLVVEVLADGSLRAVGVASAEARSGTENAGLSTGNQVVGEARHDRRVDEGKDDDDPYVAPPLAPPVSGSPTATPPVTPTSTPTQPPVGTGTLIGSVLNAQTGAGISGATVVVVGVTSGITSPSGSYNLSGLAPGTYQVQASATGFAPQTQTVVITANVTSAVNFALATAFPDITFTLTWGALPPDLDAHLSGPAPGGSRFHAFFLAPNPVTYASLTLQDRDGFGPEQMVIRPDPSTGQYVAGEYRFWVHNFSATPGFDVSQARVVISQGSQVLGTFDVSAASGNPALPLWHVANVQIDAAGIVTLVPQQRFTAGDSFVILSPPYGEKPAGLGLGLR